MAEDEILADRAEQAHREFAESEDYSAVRLPGAEHYPYGAPVSGNKPPDPNDITPWDLFAAAALCGNLANSERDHRNITTTSADRADAMMAEREKRTAGAGGD